MAAEPPARGLYPASAAILAGGEGRRMGSDKGLVTVRGRPLVSLVAERLEDLFEEVFIVGEGPAGRDAYGFTGLRTVPDRSPGMGPLMGIASALDAALYDTLFVAACDMPSIDAGLVRRLMAALAEGWDCAVPRVGENLYEPLFAVYRRRVLPAVEEVLAAGGRKVRAVFPHVRTRFIDAPVPGGILNLNTQEDLSAFEKSRLIEA